MAQVIYLLLFMFHSIFVGFLAIDIARLVQYFGGINVAEFADQSFHVSFDIFETFYPSKGSFVQESGSTAQPNGVFSRKDAANACKRFLSQDEGVCVSLYNRTNRLLELWHRWEN